MGILLDLLNLAVYTPFLNVDEEDIGRNMKYLKKYHWFRSYLEDEKYREIIIHHKEVRQCIGKFNRDQLHKSSYQKKCQRKLYKVLQKGC